MSDPSIPDFHRRGADLIARIDELAKARDIDPDKEFLSWGQDGNGWIYLLLACRRQLLGLEGWKAVAKGMTNVADVINQVAKTQNGMNKLILKLSDATS